MALLQLSSPGLPAPPGEAVAQLYEALQQPTLAACQHQLCQQLARQVSLTAFHWQRCTARGQPLPHDSDAPTEPAAPALSAAQRARLAELPLQSGLQSLTGPLFGNFSHPTGLRQRCARTGVIHTFFISLPSPADPDGALAQRLAHLIHIDALYRLNHARQQCLGAPYACALYDTAGRCIEQNPAHRQQPPLAGPARPLTVASNTDAAGPQFHEIAPQLYRIQPLDGYTLIDTLPLPAEFRQLSPREKQICFYLMQALSNRQIAAALNSAEKTLENQLSALYRKLKIRSRAQLIHQLNTPD